MTVKVRGGGKVRDTDDEKREMALGVTRIYAYMYCK